MENENKKYNKTKLILIILILSVGAILLKFYVVKNNNAEVCSRFWDEECFGYSGSKEMCYCESGEKITTKEMILEENEQRAKINKYGQLGLIK